MNKRKDLFDIIKEKHLTAHEKMPEQLLHKTWEYYQMVDLKYDTQMASIFYDLYMVDNLMTYDNIAYIHHISLATLYRYRIRFNDFAAKLLLLATKAD